MNTFTAVVEKDFDTNLYVGYVPGFPGVHSQGETLDKLRTNLCEVIEMLLEDEQTEKIPFCNKNKQRNGRFFSLLYITRSQPIYTTSLTLGMAICMHVLPHRKNLNI